MRLLPLIAAFLLGLPLFAASTAPETTAPVTVASLADLARVAAADNQTVRMAPGVYPLADYLTPAVLADIAAGVDRKQSRPPVPMFTFTGNGNRFDFTGVVFEIDTALYSRLPGRSYIRCLIIAGDNNTFNGLTIRQVGAQRGSGGNTLSVAGTGNTLENFTVHVHGSHPYGYGDLFGKGGPNLLGIQKQSGIQILGANTLVRRTRVISRAFGHCFYIQNGGGIRLEDCYAEGVMRSTSDMLRDTSGPAFDLAFRSVYENRDGRYVITPGYMKSLVEDGFRTYGGAGSVTLVNCTAINTRAGFEIGARDDATVKTEIIGGNALGCERGYLIGSHTVVRDSRGDIAHGPLLYLRGGLGSDVELELTGDGPAPGATVHALATIAGQNHRVKLTRQAHEKPAIALPIMFGFGMPDHAEMASPIRPAPTRNITLINTITTSPVITSDTLEGSKIETAGRELPDTGLRASPGTWNLPKTGVAR
ncbi:MAG: hypothetical protein K0R17_3186 [Rariglobus sp.]|jgi:hypothetical protein|nr:hypothetical protein [Rariglobus sp.]